MPAKVDRQDAAGATSSGGEDASFLSAVSRPLASPSSSEDPQQFLSAASTLSRTLVDSRDRPRSRGDEDETTLADSVVDSMHSCADTLVGSEDDATLHEDVGGGADGGSDVEDVLDDDEFFAQSPEEQMQRFAAAQQGQRQRGETQGLDFTVQNG